ncbi:MAG: hypothetical protein ACRDLK_00980 [Gaiellaceae bacterium]
MKKATIVTSMTRHDMPQVPDPRVTYRRAAHEGQSYTIRIAASPRR